MEQSNSQNLKHHIKNCMIEFNKGSKLTFYAPYKNVTEILFSVRQSYYVRGAVFTHAVFLSYPAIFKWNFPLWRMNDSRDWPEFNTTERNYRKHWPKESPSSLAFRVLINPFVGQERDMATMVCFLPWYALHRETPAELNFISTPKCTNHSECNVLSASTFFYYFKIWK